jgi:ribosome-binding factor A
MHGLKSAAGFVQTKIAERLTTRFVPHVTFIRDEGVKKSIEIARLIREANEQSEADAQARAASEATEQPAAAEGSANPAD